MKCALRRSGSAPQRVPAPLTPANADTQVGVLLPQTPEHATSEVKSTTDLIQLPTGRAA